MKENKNIMFLHADIFNNFVNTNSKSFSVHTYFYVYLFLPKYINYFF